MAPIPLSLTGHLALQDVELEWAGATPARPMRLRWDRLRFDGQTRLGWPIQSPTGSTALALEDGRLQVDGLALREGDQPDQIEAFLARVQGDALVTKVESAPMLRGVLTQINGRPAKEVAGEHWVVASGEADLACRITHVAKGAITAATSPRP